MSSALRAITPEGVATWNICAFSFPAGGAHGGARRCDLAVPMPRYVAALDLQPFAAVPFGRFRCGPQIGSAFLMRWLSPPTRLRTSSWPRAIDLLRITAWPPPSALAAPSSLLRGTSFVERRIPRMQVLDFPPYEGGPRSWGERQDAVLSAFASGLGRVPNPHSGGGGNSRQAGMFRSHPHWREFLAGSLVSSGAHLCEITFTIPVPDPKHALCERRTAGGKRGLSQFVPSLAQKVRLAQNRLAVALIADLP